MLLRQVNFSYIQESNNARLCTLILHSIELKLPLLYRSKSSGFTNFSPTVRFEMKMKVYKMWQLERSFDSLLHSIREKVGESSNMLLKIIDSGAVLTIPKLLSPYIR